MALLDKEVVRTANRLEDLIPDLTREPLSRNGGRELLAYCAFHGPENTPSMRINVEKQAWFCDVCSFGGDAFEFMQRFLHLTFPEAKTWLADRAGLSPQNGQRRTSSPPVASQANATPRPARWPQDHMLRSFDYPQPDGLIARKVRYEEEKTGRKCGWLHSRDNGQTWFHKQGCEDPGLYAIEQALALAKRKGTDAMLLTEGERDARRALDLGFPAVSPPHGGSLTMGDKWTAAYADRLKAAGVGRAYLFGDHDPIGAAFNDHIARSLIAVGIDARPVPWDATEPEKFDLTDFLDRHGDGEGRRLLGERILAVKRGHPWRDATPGATVEDRREGTGTGAYPIVTCLSDVVPEDVTWIWQARLASGKLNLLVGDPGLGKSFVTLDVVSRFTTGRAWPDGSPGGPIGSAILLSAEDGLADTIRPRLDALGGDPLLVHHIATVREGRDVRGIQLADVAALERAILQTSARLIVIDPVSAYVGEKDSHRDSEVRGLLAPLAQLAEQYHVTILGVMHLSKNSQRAAIYRTIGSIAFVGAARVALAVVADPEQDERRFLAPIKSNLSASPAVLAFSIPDGRLLWEPDAVIGVDVDGLLRGPSGDRDERRESDEWLRELLQDGPVLVKTIEREARDAGMSKSTIERAKGRIHARAVKDGKSGPWSWELELSSKAVTLIRRPSPENDGLQQIPKDSLKAVKSDSLTAFKRPWLFPAPVVSGSPLGSVPNNGDDHSTLAPADIEEFDIE